MLRPPFDPQARPCIGSIVGRPAVIAAGGPSLRGQIAGITAARRAGTCAVIGVNSTGLKIDCDAAVIYDWHVLSAEAQAGQTAETRLIFAPAHYVTEPLDTLVPVTIQPHILYGLCDRFGGALCANGGGAGLAISVAWALGCDPILLCGYDYTDTGADYRYWYGGRCLNVEAFRDLRDGLASLATLTGNRIVNCSPDSTLGGFPRGDLRNELDKLRSPGHRRADRSRKAPAERRRDRRR